MEICPRNAYSGSNDSGNVKRRRCRSRVTYRYRENISLLITITRTCQRFRKTYTSINRRTISRTLYANYRSYPQLGSRYRRDSRAINRWCEYATPNRKIKEKTNDCGRYTRSFKRISESEEVKIT